MDDQRIHSGCASVQMRRILSSAMFEFPVGGRFTGDISIKAKRRGLRMRSCLQLTTNREEQRASLSEEEEKSMIEGVRPTEDELDCGSSVLHLFQLQTHRRRPVKGKGCGGSSQCCSE